MNELSEQNLTGRQYEKLANWGERFALVVFGSLVLQRLLTKASVPVIVLGIIVTMAGYTFAYRALKRSR